MVRITVLRSLKNVIVIPIRANYQLIFRIMSALAFILNMLSEQTHLALNLDDVSTAMRLDTQNILVNTLATILHSVIKYVPFNDVTNYATRWELTFIWVVHVGICGVPPEKFFKMLLTGSAT